MINNQNNQDIVTITDKCVILHNSFSTGNAGHDLFCIFNTLQKYKNDNEIKFVLFNEVKNNNVELIKLFVDESKIITINSDKIYNFKNQLFNYEIGNHPVLNYINIIKELREKITNKIKSILTEEEIKNLENRKIIIIKNSNMSYIIRKEDCFIANNLFEYLKSLNWYVVNPETDNFLEMAYSFLNASIIITSDRGISCANQCFYNLNAKIYAFLVNNKNIIEISNNSKIRKDTMCNMYYFNFVKGVIFNESHKKLFENL